MTNIPTREIEGDVAVGRHVWTGGNVNVAGNADIGHNLRVKGWLEAPNIKGVLKGLFISDRELKEVYPKPEPGWIALVGHGLPAAVWRGSKEGEWIYEGGTSGDLTVSLTSIEGAIAANGESISNLKLELTNLIDGIKRWLVVEGDERNWHGGKTLVDLLKYIRDFVGMNNANSSAPGGESLAQWISALRQWVDLPGPDAGEFTGNNLPVQLKKEIAASKLQAVEFSDSDENVQLSLDFADPKADPVTVYVPSATDKRAGFMTAAQAATIEGITGKPGKPMGIARLDETGKLPEEQVPGLYMLDVTYDKEQGIINGMKLTTGTDILGPLAAELNRGRKVRLLLNINGGELILTSSSVQKAVLETSFTAVFIAEGRNARRVMGTDYDVEIVLFASARDDISSHFENSRCSYESRLTQIEETYARKDELPDKGEELFRKLWDEAWRGFGKFDPNNAPDEEHQYFGNEVWMSLKEAITSWIDSIQYISARFVGGKSKDSYSILSPSTKTLIPIACQDAFINLGYGYGLETIRFRKCNYTSISLYNCTSLRKILGTIFQPKEISFTKCAKLEEVSIENLNINISFGDSPNLSLASVRYMVDNSFNGSNVITITVHPDVYAKLTDDHSNAAVQATPGTELAQWIQLLSDANARNISFACA